MSNMQDDHGLFIDRIEKFEWISTQGHDPDPGTRGQALPALRHYRNPRDRRPNVGLERRGHCGTQSPPALTAYLQEVGNRARRILDPHGRRNAAKAASTSSLLASSPRATCPSASSMACSSSGIA